MKVFVTWSGGKESALACYGAKLLGLQVSHLVNMISQDGRRSMSHGLPPGLISLQAQAMGVPIVQRPTTWEGYEADFKETILTLKEKGVTGGVFGDIDLKEHRDWDDRVSRELKIRPYLPLWGKDQIWLLDDFIRLGFEATVVVTKAGLLGEEWLGRKIDEDFIEDISKLKGAVTPCGEAGEYHTFVTSGPIFKERINILKARKVLKEKHWMLEILDYAFSKK